MHNGSAVLGQVRRRSIERVLVLATEGSNRDQIPADTHTAHSPKESILWGFFQSRAPKSAQTMLEWVLAVHLTPNFKQTLFLEYTYTEKNRGSFVFV